MRRATLAGFAVGAWLESHDRREHVASTRFSPKPTARLNLQPSLPPMHALTLRFIDADLEARFLEQLETSYLGFAVLVMLLLAATATSPAAVHLTVGIAVQLGLRVVTSNCSLSPRAAPPTSSSSTRTSAKTCSAPSSRRRRARAASTA